MNLRLPCSTEAVLAYPVGCRSPESVSYYNYTSVLSCWLEAAWEAHDLSWKSETKSTNS